MRSFVGPGLGVLFLALASCGGDDGTASGTGNPDYGKYPISMLLYINEVAFYTQRPLVHMIMGSVFERFPKLNFVLTEIGAAIELQIQREIQ